jgi:broad specificity phosphatase PhoE
MSILILMRHGQALFGADSYDALSDVGRKQASITGAWLRQRDQRFFAVWHGPRRRHADTANEVMAGKAMAAKSFMTPGLDEFGEGEEVLAAAAALFGRTMSGPNAPSRREQLRCYDQAIAEWSRGAIEIPGRQGFQSFRSAVRGWLYDRIHDGESPAGRCELAVTSAGVISAAVCEALNLPDSQWHPLLRVIQNASVTEFAFSGGRCGLRSFNNVGYLPEALLSAI